MKYVALLRGVNVSGQKKIGMADLRAMCTGLGLGDVQTYVQSGNVVFTSPVRSGAKLAGLIRQGIARDWGFTVPVMVRTHAEITAVVADCPFGPVDVERDGTRVFVAFLSGRPAPERAAALAAVDVAPEALVVGGCEVYLHCPGGAGDSKLTTALLERKLGVDVTARNWRTVLQLHAMSA